MKKIVLCMAITAFSTIITTSMKAAASSRSAKKGAKRIQNFVTVNNEDIAQHIGRKPIFSPKHVPQETSDLITTFPLSRCCHIAIESVNDRRFIVTSAMPDRNGSAYLLNKSITKALVVRGTSMPHPHAPEVAFQAYLGIDARVFTKEESSLSKTYAAQLLLLQMEVRIPLQKYIEMSPFFTGCVKYEEKNPGLLCPLSGEILRDEGMKRLKKIFAPDALAHLTKQGHLDSLLCNMVKRILDSRADDYRMHSLGQQATLASSKSYWKD